MKEKNKIKQSSISIKARIKSFGFAFNGINILFGEEPNSVIHLIMALIVIAAGILLKINSSEWIAVIISIGLVFIIEIINSAIENICDFISPELNESIKKIKDLAAAAVLVSAITAITIGVIVFLPKLIFLVFA